MTNIEKLKQSGRKGIIRFALDILRKDQIAGNLPNKNMLSFGLFNPKLNRHNFRVIIKANQQSLAVNFDIPVKYVPRDSAAYYGVGVQVFSGKTQIYPVRLSNPQGYAAGRAKDFYIPAKEEQKRFQFVLDVVHKEREWNPLELKDAPREEDMIVYEQQEYYQIERRSPHQISRYKIHKTSGKIYEVSHAHTVPPPSFKQKGNESPE